jgi:hypothetical protein
MMFIRSFVFFLGVLAAFALGWIGIVGVPDMMLARIEAPPELKRYTAEQLYGRSIYVRDVCTATASRFVPRDSARIKPASGGVRRFPQTTCTTNPICSERCGRDRTSLISVPGKRARSGICCTSIIRGS